MPDNENTDPLAGHITWPGGFAKWVKKSSRTVQRWRRLGKGPRLTWMGNSATVSPENQRAYIRKNTETAA